MGPLRRCLLLLATVAVLSATKAESFGNSERDGTPARTVGPARSVSGARRGRVLAGVVAEKTAEALRGTHVADSQLARKRRAAVLARIAAARRARAAAASRKKVTLPRAHKRLTPAQVARYKAWAAKKKSIAARLRAMALLRAKRQQAVEAKPLQAIQCPTNPAEGCDFYFEGSQDTIPTFTLPADKAEKPISPPILTSVDTSLTVNAVNSEENFYADSQPPGTDPQTGKNPQLANLFYATYSPGVIVARNLQSFNFSLSGTCVGVRLQSVQISAVDGGSTFNLNPGDGNATFAEPRRCVMFKIA